MPSGSAKPAAQACPGSARPSHCPLPVNSSPTQCLPAKQAARQSGWKPIPGIKYRRFKWALASPRLAWVVATEAARTAAQLAICLRQLDAVLQVLYLCLL
jgi:hypothetical protein